MRILRQPGPEPRERAVVVPCRVDAVTVELEAGRSVEAAVAASGFRGYLDFAGVELEPLGFVIPALSQDDMHAAWYSQATAMERARIDRAGAIAGTRDGRPFVHCHGLWAGRMGHLLPADSEIVGTLTVAGWRMSGAVFEAVEDEETNFKLFSPRAEGVVQSANGLAVRLRPNQDVCLAVETICRTHAIDNARIFGIGSTVGARFENGRGIDSPASELLIDKGRLINGVCSLDISIVDIDGRLDHGVLKRGENGVCITFELLIHASDT